MASYLATSCTAFSGTERLAQGDLIDVALAIKAAEGKTQGPVLTFDDASGAVIDLDLRGTTADIVARLSGHARAAEAEGAYDQPARSRGRPKLGVVGREVTLLPRHWEWLGKQSGGASQTLRRLVDAARRGDSETADKKAAHERTYRFLSAMAGDLPGFEEVIRALFSGDTEAFVDRMADWPPDLRDHALLLARPKAERNS